MVFGCVKIQGDMYAVSLNIFIQFQLFPEKMQFHTQIHLIRVKRIIAGPYTFCHTLFHLVLVVV